jgi:hypothetical protein
MDESRLVMAHLNGGVSPGLTGRLRSSLAAWFVPFVAMALAACSEAQPPRPADGAVGAIGEPGTPPTGAGPVLQRRMLNEWYSALLVDRNAISDPHELEAIARPMCDGLDVCAVNIWYDEADMPTQIPMREIELRYQVFAFGRTATGRESVLWNCNVFPEFEGVACLPRVLDRGAYQP